MTKDKQQTTDEELVSLLEKIKTAVKYQTGKQYVPNIIEFCTSSHYLFLPVVLYPVQQIILKVFYRGQPGNENVELTEAEIQLLFEYKLDNVLEKYHSGQLFRELVLVLGRRCISGDTLVFDANTGESKSVSDWHKDNGELTVWTLNEELSQFEKHLAKTIYQGKRDCVRVVLENGDYVDCTANHPLLTVDGWSNVEDLKPGDRVGMSKFYSVNRVTTGEPREFIKIKSITPVGTKKTYDLTIIHEDVNNDTCRNFIISNGLQMHNSGKDFMVSLMALYEVMRLLEIPGGSPFSYYGIAEGNPIFILTVANSADQARILFTEIKEKMTSSDYFRDKIGHMEADKISLLTPQDKKKRKKLLEDGLDNAASKVKGSVVIMSGHSNSESLLGKRIYSLLLDEVASFKTTGGATSGDRIYSALGPATADFVRKIGKFDEEGNELSVIDSKIISISSPRSEEGMLFKLYNDTPNIKSRLAFKLPTWKVSKQWNEETLRQEFKFMSANEFNMEFGAEFSGTAGEKFIPDHYIDEALEIGTELELVQRNAGIPGIVYYAHLDPAATSHNYALVVLHVEERMRLTEKNNQIYKEKIKMYIVDHLKCWQPEGGKSINVYDVDKYIVDLAKRFRFGMVSYDNWNSQASVQMLRRKGIPTKITPFRRDYKMRIYDQLEHLLVNHQLALPRKTPFSQMVEMELKCLKRTYLPTGFKIEPNPEAQITTDDFCDAIAGACGLASESIYTGYPQGALVNMPQMPSLGKNSQWRIGNATISDQQWQLWNRKFGI